jgi:hypothetical protein
MSKTRIPKEKKSIEELMAKRNVLFARLSKNPLDTLPALEIRAIDDQIAELRFETRIPTHKK